MALTGLEDSRQTDIGSRPQPSASEQSPDHPVAKAHLRVQGRPSPPVFRHAPAGDLAALTKRLIEVVRDIEAIDAAHEQDGDDDAEVEDGEFDASAV